MTTKQIFAQHALLCPYLYPSTAMQPIANNRNIVDMLIFNDLAYSNSLFCEVIYATHKKVKSHIHTNRCGLGQVGQMARRIHADYHMHSSCNHMRVFYFLFCRISDIQATYCLGLSLAKRVLMVDANAIFFLVQTSIYQKKRLRSLRRILFIIVIPNRIYQLWLNIFCFDYKTSDTFMPVF